MAANPGPPGVAQSLPAHATSPADPAYDWSLYDPIVKQLTGAAIGRPGRARGEYAPTAVVPRPFRR